MREFIQNLKICYHSGFGDNLGKDFYSPCLARCVEYKRTTGDFTSNVILDWGKALINIVRREDDKCVIKIIANPNLPEEDKLTLKTFVDNKNREDFYDKITHNIFVDTLNLVEKNLNRDKGREIKLKIFCYLIVTKKLILKFGFPKHVSGANVFHTKRGIFYFNDNLKVGFSGSSNETHGGHLLNIEDINIYKNLDGINPHIEDIEKKFELSWEGKAPGFDTRKINQKTLDLISSYAPSKNKLKEYIKAFEEIENSSKLIIDESLKNNPILINKETKDHNASEKKWSFQNDAVEIFLKEKNGILEMATGTGKTRTTFKIIGKLIDDKRINKIVIQMKGTELISQWEKELNDWQLNRNEIIRTLKQNEEKKDLDKFIANFKSGNDNIDIIFISQFFLPELLSKLKDENLSKTLIVHDEVHNLPTNNMITQIEGLQKNIAYKLGLSATVEDEYDGEKHEKLFKEIGPIIFSFKLEDAIKRGILVEFEVDFITYELTKEEKKDKQKWMIWRENQIKKKSMPINKLEEIFRREVSKINKLAINKLEKLESYIKDKLHLLEKCFIFALEMNYGDMILQKLIKYIPEIKTHYDEHADKKNLQDFASGDLKCIINCRMLNEGINMKSLSNIILVSSESKRQLIQRLGRVLRIDEDNNPNKKAFVLDFIEDTQLKNMKGPDYKRYEYLNELSKVKKGNL